jgi:cell division protein FtsQ
MAGPAADGQTSYPAPADVTRPGRLASAAARVVRFLAEIAFLCGVVSFAGSSLFDVRSVDVAGNQAVAASEILDRAGVRPEVGLFTVNAEQMGQRLRQDPRIAGVSVGVTFPDRVHITVRERQGVAALRVLGGYILVGADGVAIGSAAGAGSLPALTVDRLDPAAVWAGTVIPSADARLGAAVAGSLPADLRRAVAAVRVDHRGEVILYLRDGVGVRMGSADGIDDRLAKVTDVLDAVRAQGMRVEYIDLRFPGSIIVKPVGAPARPAGNPG